MSASLYSSLESSASLDVPSASRIRHARAFLAPHRVRLSSILATGLFASLLGACEPLIYKVVFDAFGAGDVGRAGASLGALVVLLLAREAGMSVLDWMVWRVRIAINFDMLAQTIDRLHSLPLSHHREENVGAVMTKIERGISGVLGAFSDVAFQLVPSFVYLLASAVFMWRLEWRLALVVIAFAPIPAIVGARASKEQMARERELMGRWTRLFARLNEMLAGIAVVKSFVREEEEKRRFLGGVAEANATVVRGVGTDAKTAACKQTAMALARVAAIAAGGVLVLRHEITLGTLVAFLGYIGGVFQPVHALTGVYQTLRKGIVSMDVVASLLDAEDTVGDRPHARDVGRVMGHVQFDDVEFEYRPGVGVLRGIDLDVRVGETVALVGASGAGKSTLLALLQRLYEPTRGRIVVDGIDIRDLKQKSLRRQIGVVLQEGVLFDDSIRDNIRFGRPDATDEDVEAAARSANADEFIRRLPNGYETKVGERGCKLSGGERQRIAIARALLKDAPILLLDEATSALDARSEDAVRDALQRLRRGRTTFVVAHRLSTVTEADRIVVLDGGRIVETGTHERLMRAGGPYAALVASQTRSLVLPARVA